MIFIQLLESRLTFLSTLVEGAIDFLADRIDSWVKGISSHLLLFDLVTLTDMLLHFLCKFSTHGLDDTLLTYLLHNLHAHIIDFGNADWRLLVQAWAFFLLRS